MTGWRLHTATTAAGAGASAAVWRAMAPEWAQQQIDVVHMVTGSTFVGLAAGMLAYRLLGGAR